jgi:hypothetical protein
MKTVLSTDIDPNRAPCTMGSTHKTVLGFIVGPAVYGHPGNQVGTCFVGGMPHGQLHLHFVVPVPRRIHN